MSRKETVLPEASLVGRKYEEDKPKSCNYCYWWQPLKNECILLECFYLMPEEIPDPDAYMEGHCKTCAYGKHTPCIGYCIAKILKESRKKVSECKKK